MYCPIRCSIYSVGSTLLSCYRAQPITCQWAVAKSIMPTALFVLVCNGNHDPNHLLLFFYLHHIFIFISKSKNKKRSRSKSAVKISKVVSAAEPRTKVTKRARQGVQQPTDTDQEPSSSSQLTNCPQSRMMAAQALSTLQNLVDIKSGSESESTACTLYCTRGRTRPELIVSVHTL